MKRTITALFLICALLLGLCSCGGYGSAPCTECAEKGYNVCAGHTCTMRSGAGAQSCAGCNGTGTIAGGSMNCFAYSGSGTAPCFLCDSTGITYNNNRDDLGGSGGSGGSGGIGGSGGTNHLYQCYYCSGTGRKTCSVCESKAKIGVLKH